MIEGGHHCEAACRTLQGFQLGDTIPLSHKDDEIPSGSTIFKPIPTQLYFPQNDELKLNDTILQHLKAKSKHLAEQKEKIVRLTWHDFFVHIADDINNHPDLQLYLFEDQSAFYSKEVHYRDICTEQGGKSQKIRKYLNEILTNAIFEYQPCKSLLNVFEEKNAYN